MKKFKNLFLTLLGTMMTGFAIGAFLTPNQVVGGGASGIGTILYHTFGFPPGVSFFVINLIFLLLGLRVLGKKFILKTLLGITLLSGFTQLFNLIPIYTEDMLLSVVFGGGLYGLGIGMCFAAGASSGGTDIIGRIIQTKFPHVPIGTMLLFVDGIIIATSFIVFKNLELTLYGVMTLLVSSFCIDFIIGRLNVSRLVFVVTDRGEEIARHLVSTSPRGVTLIPCTGSYTNEERQMLFCAMKESEVPAFQKKILEFDPHAFIVFAESQRIKGNGFYLYQ